jgi:ABC-type glycerol-3-phosphate transport system substrate-binding protein
VTEYGHLPARRSVAQQIEYWDQYSPETRELLQAASEHFIVRSSMNPFALPLNSAISQTLEDGTSVVESLREAQISMEEVLTPIIEDEAFSITYPNNEDRTTIRFSVSPHSDSVLLRALADEFESSQDDVKVEFLEPNAVGDSDCFSDVRIVNNVDATADLLPLDPFLDDTTITTTDFTSVSINSLTVEGQLFGLPLRAMPRVMFFNPELFDQTSVPYPEPEWTLDDFRNTAIALTDTDNPPVYGYLPINGGESDLGVFIALNNGDPVDENGLPQLDTPQMIAALQWFADLSTVHQIFPPELLALDAQDEREQLVQDGRVAMWSGFLGINRINTALTDDIFFVPLPATTKSATDILFEGLFIPVHSGQRQSCWGWISFLSDNSVDNGTYSLLVKQESLINVNGAYRSSLSPELVDVLLRQENLLADSLSLEYRNLLSEALESVLQGGTPETALANAQRQAISSFEASE